MGEVDVAVGYYELLLATGPLLRAGGNMRNALQSGREKVRGDRSLVVLRDRASDVEREAELLHADAGHAMDYSVARRAEEQARLANELNRSSHRLNLMAALFLPLTAIGAALGMNMKSGLEEAPPVLFWLILVMGLGGGLFVHIVTRRAASDFHLRAERHSQKRSMTRGASYTKVER